MTGDGDYSYDPNGVPCWLVEIWADFDTVEKTLNFQWPANYTMRIGDELNITLDLVFEDFFT